MGNKMTLFLNGGGSARQMIATYHVFRQCVDVTKPLLYVPIAKPLERHADCFKWVSGELADLNFCQIKMVSMATELAVMDLKAYGAVFIGGGNTYKLLKELKDARNEQGVSAFEKLKNYVRSGGTVLGGSAGAIIFGKQIDSCRHADENNVNLTDTSGFDMAFGACVGAHYTNRTGEKAAAQQDNYTTLSHQTPVIALPEECTLCIDETTVRLVGEKDCYLFKNGVRRVLRANVSHTLEAFQSIIDGD